MLTVNWDANHYSSRQFGVWRAAFGFYLLYYYVRIFPYATEIFSNAGAFPTTQLSSRSFFPTFLLNFDSPQIVQGLIGTACLCSLLIMVGFLRRTAAFILWLLIMWFYNKNFFTDSPDYSFTNWLVVILILIPSGEQFALTKKDEHWEMPSQIYWAAWIILAIGYMEAGTSKIKFSDSAWIDGSALYYVMTTDNTRFAWYGSFFDRLPQYLFFPITYGVVFLQTLAPIFVFIRKTRFAWWLGIMGLQLMILIFINLPQVTWGMILFHLFIWDSDWNRFFPRRK